MATRVLAGDIGGTKTALAVYRFEALMRETPVQVILDPKASLLGAAEVALDLALDTAPKRVPI